MKYAKANTLRTQQAIARFGKSARHPICQAALVLWQREEEIHKYAEDAESLGERLGNAKRQKEEVRALYQQIYNEGKQKEAIEAAALVRKTADLFKEIQNAFEANVRLFESLSKVFYPVAVAQFRRACDAVTRTKDTTAIGALQRVEKRWRANPSGKGARLRDGDRRELEILNMHRDKVIKAAWAKGGATAGYREAVSGGDRLLSDEVWQERFTVKDIYLHLLAAYGPNVAGDKYGKEIRRTMRRLGIRWAEDQRGRKWKMPSPKKQEPRRPVGRPRKAKLICADKIDSVQPFKARKQNWEWRPPIEFARKQAAIDRELARLRRTQTSL